MALEIHQDKPFQRREWRVERVGWALIAAFVVAGALGLVGPGPLSSTTSSSERGVVQAEFDRVTHYEADDTVTLTFGPAAVVDGAIEVTITGSWPGGVDLQSVFPEPSAQRAVPGGVVLELEAGAAGDLSTVLGFRAQELGTLSADVRVATTPSP